MVRNKALIAGARDFSKDQRGASAIEFALVAPLLFFALLSLLEIGVLGMVTTSLDNGLIEASRRIRTGASDAPTSASGFEDQVCAAMANIFGSCRDRLVISVQKYSAFASAGAAVSARPAGEFNRGAANDIILVKADYRWPLMSPFVAIGYNRNSPLEVTVSSRVAFKNEPFE